MKKIIIIAAVACLAATNVFGQAVRQATKAAEAARAATTGSTALKGAAKSLGNAANAAKVEVYTGAVGAAATKPTAANDNNINENLANILSAEPASNQTAEALGVQCIPSDSAAYQAGIGGARCYKDLDTKAASVAKRAQIAGLHVLSSAGIKNISAANDNLIANVAVAMGDSIASSLSLSNEEEGLQRLKATCENGCDIASSKVCAAIR